MGACDTPKWQRLLGVVLAGGCAWCHSLGSCTDVVQEEGSLADRLFHADDLQGLLRTLP